MDGQKFTLLAIDDDKTQLELLRLYAREIDFPDVEFLAAENVREGLAMLAGRTIDLVLTDYRLPDGTGIDVLEEVKKRNPLISVVVMTSFENVQDAVTILTQGGDDYLVKPTQKPDIEHLIVRIFEQSSIARKNKQVDEEIRESFDDLPIVYRSNVMKNVLNLVSRSAGTDARVLITGESGTGKELIARLIHQTSKRSEKPFITVNIAALPETLMESELFGHAKGSYTGADSDRTGRFEEADGGTLFIDEVGEIPLPVQVKLLRAVQFGQLQRLGENRTRKLDVRIIAATNRDLERMISENLFRADLFWRLNVINITIPPLRERKIDIPALVELFIARYNEKNGRSITGISREALDRLMEYRFPGNIRELENIIERAVILSRGRIISMADLPLPDSAPAVQGEGCEDFSEEGYEIQLQRYEKRLIESALEAAEGNQSEAARILQIYERRLRSRLEILGLKNPHE
jgi:DNA-binding NtrC family response regulator